MKSGLSAVQMAKHFGCSSSLVYKKLKQHNMNIRSKYSTMSDGQLDDHVRDMRVYNVNAGNEVCAFNEIMCNTLVNKFFPLLTIRKEVYMSSYSSNDE